MVQERVQFTLAAKNDLSLSTESKEFEDVKTFFSQISSENPPKKPTAPDYSSRQGEIDGAIWSNKISRMGLVPVCIILAGVTLIMEVNLCCTVFLLLLTIVGYAEDAVKTVQKKFDDEDLIYENALKRYNDYLSEQIDPKIIFDRLNKTEGVVSRSSYTNLGIRPKVDEITKPCYIYGPYLEPQDFLSAFGFISKRIDSDGPGRGAHYYRVIDYGPTKGIYFREYEMMVIHFAENHIMIYKCVFDILELTKIKEQTFEFSYNHVVGIRIFGDDSGKDLSSGVALTGSKRLEISLTSGEKVGILINATAKMGEEDFVIGGEHILFENANRAMVKIRKVLRVKSGN